MSLEVIYIFVKGLRLQQNLKRMPGSSLFKLHAGVLWCSCTCEPAGLSQQEGAPGHEEKERCLQQREVSQLSELGHVIKTESQGLNEHWHTCSPQK